MSSVSKLKEMWEKKAQQDKEHARGDVNNYNTNTKVNDINTMMGSKKNETPFIDTSPKPTNQT